MRLARGTGPRWGALIEHMADNFVDLLTRKLVRFNKFVVNANSVKQTSALWFDYFVMILLCLFAHSPPAWCFRDTRNSVRALALEPPNSNRPQITNPGVSEIWLAWSVKVVEGGVIGGRGSTGQKIVGRFQTTPKKYTTLRLWG